MNIAGFKVSHSIDTDIDATTLRAARARSSSMGAMERYTWVRYGAKLTLACHDTPQNSERTSGAMEDMSGKVQNANTHILRCQNHEHTHSSQSVQGQVQWGDGGNV